MLFLTFVTTGELERHQLFTHTHVNHTHHIAPGETLCEMCQCVHGDAGCSQMKKVPLVGTRFKSERSLRRFVFECYYRSFEFGRFGSAS